MNTHMVEVSKYGFKYYKLAPLPGGFLRWPGGITRNKLHNRVDNSFSGKVSIYCCVDQHNIHAIYSYSTIV